MTSTQISIETAPRDLEGLKKVGRFNLRILAQAIGLFETEANKTAFMQATNDQQAETIMKLLQEKDGVSKPAAGKGGAGAGAATRSPSTKNAGKAASTAGKATGAPAAGTGGGAGAEGGTGVGAGAAAILASIKELKETVDGFQASIENLQASVDQLQGISAGTNRFVALSIGLAGKLAEQVMGASLDQILEVVLEDMPAVEAAMQKMAPAEEETDDETDAGNEE